MALLKKCLGVDVGTHAVKIAELQQDREGVKISRLLIGKVEGPPDASGEEFRAQVVSTVRRLLREHKVSTREAIFSIPGQYVFIRRLRLPRTTEERLRRIILFEAREQIPFPLEQTFIEYQVFPLEDAPEVEVLLAAIKKEHLYSYLAIFQRMGLKPIGITVSSLALFNFFGFDFTPAAAMEKKAKAGFSLSLPFLQKKPAAAPAAGVAEEEVAEAGDEGAVGAEEPEFLEIKAFVNLGASTMDIAIGTFGRDIHFGFARTVPRAGNEISRCIMEECKIEDFAEAEEKKRQEVLLSDSEAELSEKEAIDPQASMAASTAVARIAADVRRSFDFFVSQPDGMAVDHVYLCGGSADLVNLAPYLEERLGVPMELVRSVHSSAWSGEGFGDENLAAFIPAMGLALTGIGRARIQIDFLPGELKAVRELKEKKLLLVVMVGLMAGSILFSSMAGGKYVDNFITVARQYEQQVISFEPQEKKIAEAREERENLKEYFDALAGAISERDYWLRFLLKIQAKKPDDLWIELMIMDSTGKVQIKGKGENIESIISFAKSVEGEVTSVLEARDERVKKTVHEFQIAVECEDKTSRWTRPAEETAAAREPRERSRRAPSRPRVPVYYDPRGVGP